VLRPIGVTQGQFSLLISLNRAEPPTIGAVANLLALDRTTLTANLKPLARRGLVKVVVDADDKRSRRLVLTPLGRELLAAAAPVWKRAHAKAERLLKSASPDIVRAGLRELC
jgi:DNA-binding MarR family transcriptional regulator